MANNYQPIYPGRPSTPVGGQLTASSPTAVTKSDGVFSAIGTDCILVFTAAATYGSFLAYIRFHPYATAAATATTATVFRVYLSSQNTGGTTAANTQIIAEVPAYTQTVDHSTNAAQPMDVMINRPIPPGYSILVSQHAVAAANTGWQVVVFAGDYVATP